MQQVLTPLDEPVSAQDELGWRNASDQPLDKGMGEEEAIFIPQTQITDLIDFQSEDDMEDKSPAKVLALGQSATILGPGLSAIPEAWDLTDFSAEE